MSVIRFASKINTGIIALCFMLLFMWLFPACSKKEKSITISTTVDVPQIQFAINEIITALSKKGISTEITTKTTGDIHFVLQTENDLLKKEGFQIRTSKNQIELTGIDSAGLLYAGLELAEQIRIYGLDSIRQMTQNPYMELRGSKFNIPLDVRTPSYSDASDTGQHNIPVMWDFEFWKSYLDNLARYRFNYVSLWSLHPFPSLVQVPGYQNIALADVKRSAGTWKEFYDLNGIGMDAPVILKNTETLKKITIREKIEFWKKVMAYGKDRNIDFHIITWNIFTYGTNGKYGITDAIDNEITKDYYRKSIRQLFVTYPNLAGIGLTTGENMKGATPDKREDWAYETYAKGILDAAKDMPERKFTFIHRQHQTGAKEIAMKFKPVINAKNIEFLYCFKYAKAHVYSATRQPYHEKSNFVNDIKGMKTLWGLRNDDTYYLRWGAPDFVREFIKNIPYEVARGIYFGSDQWIWGTDFLTKDPEIPKQLEIVKHWYQWTLWGRLSYDPNLDNDRCKALLSDRFPSADPTALFTAWQQASMIYPITTGFHWGRLDFQWYIEGCKSHPKPAKNPSGFHDVNRFINLGTHPKSGYQAIPDYVNMKAADSTSSLKTPFEVAEELIKHADSVLEKLKSISPANSKELLYTINDIKSMALLGKYYACKIQGATHLAMYRKTANVSEQNQAIAALKLALEYWKKYTTNVLQQNKNPLWTNRVGYVDLQEITKWVAKDITIASQNPNNKNL